MLADFHVLELGVCVGWGNMKAPLTWKSFGDNIQNESLHSLTTYLHLVRAQYHQAGNLSDWKIWPAVFVNIDLSLYCIASSRLVASPHRLSTYN